MRGGVSASAPEPAPAASLDPSTRLCLALGRSSCGGVLQSPPLAPAPLTSPDSSWLNLTPATYPSGYIDARSGASMVYDVVDHEVVLFGGSGAADTWAWSHGAWSVVIPASACTATSCPSPRSYAGFAWDGADQEAVLFGGLGSAGPLGDTWTYVGGAWTNVTASAGTAPSPRWQTSMTFDSGDNMVLLFGGATALGAAFGDTWSFAGNRWTNLTATLSLAPDPRWGAAMGNSPLGYVLLFGGLGNTSLEQNNYFVTGGPYLGWWFHDGAWSPQTVPIQPHVIQGRSGSSDVEGPCGRYDAALAWSPQNARFVLFGGDGLIGNATACPTGGVFLFPLNDTWVYTAPLGGTFNMGSQGGWYNDTLAVGPTPRGDVAYAADYADNYFLMFGGNLGIPGGFASLNETWRYFERVAVVFSGPSSIEIGALGFTDFTLVGHGGSGSLLYTSTTVRLLNSRTLTGCPGLAESLPTPLPTDGVVACTPTSASYNDYRTTVTVWDSQNTSDSATAGWTFSVTPPETMRLYSQYSGYFYSGFHLDNVFGVYVEIDGQPVAGVTGTIDAMPVAFAPAGNGSQFWWNSSGVDMGSINPGSSLAVVATIPDWNDTGSLAVSIIQTPDWLQQFTELAQVVQSTKSSGSGPFGLHYTLTQQIPLPVGKLFNFSIPIPFVSGNYSIVPDIQLTFSENSSGGITLTGKFSFSTSKISFGIVDLKLTLALTVSGSFAIQNPGGGATIVWESASLILKLDGDFSISIPIYGFSFDLFNNTIKIGFNLDIDIDPSFAVTLFMVPTTNPAEELISGINLMVSDVWGEFSLPIDADLSFSIAIASVAVGGTLGIDANFAISPGPFQIGNIWINGSLYGKASFLFWSGTWNVLGPGTIYHYVPGALAPAPRAAPSAGYDNGSHAVWGPADRYYNTSGYDAQVWSATNASGTAIADLYPSAAPVAAAGFDGAYVFFTDDRVNLPVAQGLTVTGARLDSGTNALGAIPSPSDPGFLLARPQATALPDGSIYLLWDALPLAEASVASPAELTSVELHGAAYSPANQSWGPVRDWTHSGFAGSYRAASSGGVGRVAALVSSSALPGASTPEQLLTFDLASGTLLSTASVTGLASLESVQASPGEAVVKDLSGNDSLVNLSTGAAVSVGFAAPAGYDLAGVELVAGTAGTLLLRYRNATAQELVVYDPASSRALGTTGLGGDVRDAHALYNPASGAFDVYALAAKSLQGWSLAGGVWQNLTRETVAGLSSFGLVQSGGALVAYGVATSGRADRPNASLVLYEVSAGLPPVPGRPAAGGTPTGSSPGSPPPYAIVLAATAAAVAGALVVLILVTRRRRSGLRPSVGGAPSAPADPPPTSGGPPR